MNVLFIKTTEDTEVTEKKLTGTTIRSIAGILQFKKLCQSLSRSSSKNIIKHSGRLKPLCPLCALWFIETYINSMQKILILCGAVIIFHGRLDCPSMFPALEKCLK